MERSTPKPRLIQDIRTTHVQNAEPPVLGLSEPFINRRHKLALPFENELKIDEGLNETGLSIRKTVPTERRPIRLTWNLIQYPLLAAISLLAAYSVVYGQIFIGGFIIYAVIRRLPAKVSFGLALFLLLCVVLFLVLSQLGVAQNASIYVFELLVFGIFQTFLESYFTGKKPSRNRVS